MIFDACIATPFVVSSVHLYICIVASHLGTLREARGVGAGPQDGVRWTTSEGGRIRRSNRRPGPRSEGPKALVALTLT